MDRSHITASVTLVIVTALWGSTFVAIKSAVGSTTPSMVLLVRFAVAGLIFLPWLPRDRRVWWGGAKLGFWLALGYGTQTIGLQYATASQSAFITVLNVIIVPILGALSGQRIGRPVWIAAIMAIVGVGLLTQMTHLPGPGTLWTLACAFTYAVYVRELGRQARRHPTLALTATQLIAVTVFAGVWSLWDQPTLHGLPWGELLYLGLITTALTTWLQTIGQRRIDAAEAAIIYALEPVWAAFFAWLILAERLGPLGLLGAVLVCSAILVAESHVFRRPARPLGQTTVAPGEPEASLGAQYASDDNE